MKRARRTKEKLRQLEADIIKYQNLGLKNNEIWAILGISKQLYHYHKKRVIHSHLFTENK